MAKENFIRVRVDDFEKDFIYYKAKKANLNMSEFVRKAVLQKQITVLPGLNELTIELRRQGNNLNQLTIMARQGRIDMVNLEPFMEVYQQTWQALNSLLRTVA